MKVAFVTTNLLGGGAERAAAGIAGCLAKRGHEVHLVLLEHRVEHEPSAAVTLHALTAPGRRLPGGVLGKRVTAWRLRRLYRRLATDQAFDLTISTLPYADEVVQLAGLPRVWHRIANNLSAHIQRRGAQDPAKAVRLEKRYRRLYRQGNLVAVSDGVASDLQQVLGSGEANIVPICNPFDFDEIRRRAEEPVAGLPGGSYTIHVGRFAAQKRHDLLLDAWQQLPAAGLLVLLTRPEADLDRMIAARGLQDRVVVAGFQANPYPWIRNARLLVLCSDHEGMPNVLVEALVCGTPVVSTDCPSGPREILGGPLAAFLVPCGDAGALARALAAAHQSAPDPSTADLSRFEAGVVAEQYERLPACWRERF